MTRFSRHILAALIGTFPLVSIAGNVSVPDSPAINDAYESRRVALLIGVDHYGDADLQTLSFAAKDAQDMGNALGNQAIGDYDDVHVVTGMEATSREAILAKLEEVTSTLQRNDTFLLYFSGHGTLTIDPIVGTRLWFLPSDSTLDQPSKAGIEVSWLEQMLSSLEPRRRVLIMDTCHNGRGDGSRALVNARTRDRLASLRGEPPAPNAVSQVTESEARLYAAQYYQPAIEDKSLKNGVYTHYLLRALATDKRTADLDGNGLVDISEAHDYAQDLTIRHTGGIQVPRAEYRIVGREAIYLSGDPNQRSKAERALISGYDGLLASAQLFIDGQARGSLPSVIAVEPGKRKIEIKTQDGRTIHAERLSVAAGEHIQIENLVEPPKTTWAIQAGTVLATNSDALPNAAADLELSVFPAVKGRVRPSAYARVMLGASKRDWQFATDVDVSGLMPSVGVGLNYQASRSWLIGPSLEAGVLYRRYACAEPNGSTGSCDQAVHESTPTLLPGFRSQWSFAISGAMDAVIRYDIRAVPIYGQPQNGERSLSMGVVNGLSVGAVF